MRPKQYLTLIYILAFFPLLFSCSKEDELVIPIWPRYSTQLLKLYEIDTTKAAPNDTTSKWFFTYDDENRLVKDSITTATFTRVRMIQYKGSDTLAFRCINRTFTSFSPIALDTTYYTFANGACIKDTSVYYYGTVLPTGRSQTTLSYKPGVISSSFQSWVPLSSYAAIEKDVIYQHIIDKDIVHQVDTLRNYINGKLSGSRIYETSVWYLPNPNPLSNISKPITKTYFTGVGIGNVSTNQYAPEHLISWQMSASDKITYNYHFRTDGYPLTAIQTLERSGKATVTKLVFVYSMY